MRGLLLVVTLVAGVAPGCDQPTLVAPPPEGARAAALERAPRLLPAFANHAQAQAYIRRHFAAEHAEFPGSSWLTYGEYFEAEGRGFLILGTEEREYLFAGVPAEVWQQLKASPSPGRFYNQRVRGHYRFLLGVQY